jgi:toxin ParE1/3/4
MKVEITEKAATDLLQIYRYVAERNPQAAESIVAEIDRKLAHLSYFPLSGRDRSPLHPGMRSVVASPYAIFYVVTDRVLIVRILDGRRDIDAEFSR